MRQQLVYDSTAHTTLYIVNLSVDGISDIASGSHNIIKTLGIHIKQAIFCKLVITCEELRASSMFCDSHLQNVVLSMEGFETFIDFRFGKTTCIN